MSPREPTRATNKDSVSCVDLTRCPCGTSGPDSRWPVSGLPGGRCPWARLRPPPPPRLLTEAGLWHHPGERASPGGPEGCQAVPSRCRPDRSGREAGPFRAGGPSCPPHMLAAHTTCYKTLSSCGAIVPGVWCQEWRRGACPLLLLASSCPSAPWSWETTRPVFPKLYFLSVSCHPRLGIS